MPGSGGGKTSSSSSTSSSPYAGLLASMGQQMFNMAKPVAQTLSNQTSEALKTGGVNAQIPSINASIDANRQSASQSNTDLRQQLAKSGLAGTSFGDALLTEETTKTNQGIADIPGNAANAFIGAAAPSVLGMGGTGIGAVGTAGGLDRSSTGTSTPSFWDMFIQGLSAGGMGFSGTNFGTH